MFFEDDEKKLDNLEDLDVNLDESEDKSITWDELLQDNDDLDLISVKKAKGNNKASKDMLDADGEINLLSDEPEKDAFDIFGGPAVHEEDTSYDIISDSVVEFEDEVKSTPKSAKNTSRGTREVKKEAKEAKEPANSMALDEYNFSLQNKSKKGSPAILLGAVAAVFICILGVCGYFMFLKPNSLDTAKNADFSTLINQNAVSDAQPVVEQMKNDLEQNEIVQKPAVPEVKDTPAAKPDKTQEDKKVALEVKNAGRSNPFLPIANINIAGFSTVPEVDIMTPPDDYGANEEVQKLMQITVSGILYDSVKPSAIINVSGSDYFVQRGDKVDNYVVASISPTSVTISSGRNTYRAGVGQNFDNGAIAGQVIYANNKFAGASRQYTSVSEIQVNVQSNSQPGQIRNN